MRIEVDVEESDVLDQIDTYDLKRELESRGECFDPDTLNFCEDMARKMGEALNLYNTKQVIELAREFVHHMTGMIVK